jgi:hypothetical protein
MKEDLEKVKQWSLLLETEEYSKCKGNLFDSGGYCSLGLLGKLYGIPIQKLKGRGFLSRVSFESSFLRIFLERKLKEEPLETLLYNWLLKNKIILNSAGSADIESLFILVNDSLNLSFPQIATLVNEVIVPYLESL